MTRLTNRVVARSALFLILLGFSQNVLAASLCRTVLDACLKSARTAALALPLAMGGVSVTTSGCSSTIEQRDSENVSVEIPNEFLGYWTARGNSGDHYFYLGEDGKYELVSPGYFVPGEGTFLRYVEYNGAPAVRMTPTFVDFLFTFMRDEDIRMDINITVDGIPILPGENMRQHEIRAFKEKFKAAMKEARALMVVEGDTLKFTLIEETKGILTNFTIGPFVRSNLVRAEVLAKQKALKDSLRGRWLLLEGQSTPAVDYAKGRPLFFMNHEKECSLVTCPQVCDNEGCLTLSQSFNAIEKGEVRNDDSVNAPHHLLSFETGFGPFDPTNRAYVGKMGFAEDGSGTGIQMEKPVAFNVDPITGQIYIRGYEDNAVVDEFFKGRLPYRYSIEKVQANLLILNIEFLNVPQIDPATEKPLSEPFLGTLRLVYQRDF